MARTSRTIARAALVAVSTAAAAALAEPPDPTPAQERVTIVGSRVPRLDAETALTQARTTNVQALHDYATARAKLERAIGEDMVQTAAAK